MKTPDDSDVTIDFIRQHTAHMSFKRTGTMSTHLLRELMVESKVQLGESPKALVFSLHEGVDSAHFFRKISNHSRLIEPDTLIALICFSKSTLAKAKVFFEENKPDYPIAVFSEFKHGLNWIDCKLIGTETIELLSVQTTLVGMSA